MISVTDHTARVFDTDLIKVTQLVAQMGGVAQKQVNDAIDALARHDTTLARRVIELDRVVDDFQRQIGTTIDGGPASRLRVVVSNRNEVITAFPF